ncbi:DUF7511 domain-containing protein [Halorarius litoreus]|uniref:DUF7511 domain-containing protein n=1 Tax=Halorarius litoreus TaxID=2962676 RepID=UPI0020CCB146|nr:hypothetical protein [Halorarius litoreus]
MGASNHTTDTRVGPATPELRAAVATADDGTELCTIYPTHADGETQTSTWVCAEAGSFVALRDVR